MTEQDEIEKLKEWQEHQFNSGYWVGRLPQDFPLKRSWKTYIIVLIQFIFILVGTGVLILAYILTRDLNTLIAALFLIGLTAVTYLLVKRVKPLKDGKPGQERIEAGRRSENQEKKKKQPKRRKDYN